MAVVFDDQERKIGHPVEIGPLRQALFPHGVGAAAVGGQKLYAAVSFYVAADELAHLGKAAGVAHVHSVSEQRVGLKVHMRVRKGREHGRPFEVNGRDLAVSRGDPVARVDDPAPVLDQHLKNTAALLAG